jgi:hypothetical protein
MRFWGSQPKTSFSSFVRTRRAIHGRACRYRAHPRPARNRLGRFDSRRSQFGRGMVLALGLWMVNHVLDVKLPAPVLQYVDKSMETKALRL